jgi:glycosyltransferase involved in cell wall biosynthesis
MLPQLVHRIKSAGVEKNFIIPGFLRGIQVDKTIVSADVYVMPSVSEPFGLSALEAVHHNVPTIISRQSGVSEVLNHALKVDFWDIDELTDLIIGALKYSTLRTDLVSMAQKEVKTLNWHKSAQSVEALYKKLITPIH